MLKFQKASLSILMAGYYSALRARVSKHRLTILIYHRVHAKIDPFRIGDPDKILFDSQMEVLSTLFEPLQLRTALELLKEGELPRGAVAVTFDDGYSDNEEIALPILKKWNIPATFFIATKFLDGGLMWNDRVIDSIAKTEKKNIDLTEISMGNRSLHTIKEKKKTIRLIIQYLKYKPQKTRTRIAKRIESECEAKLESPMMRKEQLFSLLDAGMEIGGHTISHPILSKVETSEALTEIAQGKTELESHIGREISIFAYPNGKYNQDYNDEHVRLVKEAGYIAALTTNWGVSDSDTDPFQMPRFTPWDKTPGKFALRIMKNYLSVI